jgi:hypothetical protein
MNKDAILASVIGFGIGLVITGGILLGPNLVTKLKAMYKNRGTVASITTQISPTATPNPTGSEISIDSPTAETIIADTKVTVNGKTTPGAIVVVAGLIDETVVEATQGAYAATITVKEGKNDITVSTVGGTNPSSTKITVYGQP